MVYKPVYPSTMPAEAGRSRLDHVCRGSSYGDREVNPSSTTEIPGADDNLIFKICFIIHKA